MLIINKKIVGADGVYCVDEIVELLRIPAIGHAWETVFQKDKFLLATPPCFRSYGELKHAWDLLHDYAYIIQKAFRRRILQRHLQIFHFLTEQQTENKYLMDVLVMENVFSFL